MSAERETCDYEARSFVLAQKDQPLKKENIRAFSHTHPKSVSNGDFGSEDLDRFCLVRPLGGRLAREEIKYAWMLGLTH
jgi:hypothetical protein